MLIDHVTIKVLAGHGGKGAVAFSDQKMVFGPTGASGGTGGDVYLEAVADIGALRRFKSAKVFQAENGDMGHRSFRDGNRGKDLVLLVPRGTVVRNLQNKDEHELVNVGERLLVAKGGKRGKGNYYYRSATNTTPRESQPGLPGEEFDIELELKLIADVGLIGFPNVGKSSFLNSFTRADSPVANYAFTTLEPHLGAYHHLILADLPGLIEGASEGKGLGIKFLRHIERTRVLMHFIDAETKDPKADYETIRKELGTYNKLLLSKPEYIFISKSDTVDEKRIKEIIKALKYTKKEISPISIYDDSQMSSAKKLLSGLLKDIPKVK